MPKISGETLYNALRVIYQNNYIDDEKQTSEVVDVFIHLRNKKMEGKNLKQIEFNIEVK